MPADAFAPYLELPRREAARYAELVARWAGVCSWSHHLEGLGEQLELLAEAFSPLGGEAERVELPPCPPEDPFSDPAPAPLGRALVLRKRPEAPVRVLLTAHLDTVFPPDHPFRAVGREGDRLRGPGVADCKGGIAVLLGALEALEQSPWAEGVGWEVVLNPDEEIGSPGSAAVLARAAARSHLGLVFEPCLPDGSVVGARKGSGRFTAVVRGRAAHAGRNPEQGRNAVHALADLIVAWKAADGRGDGITVNVAQVEGGGAVNIVPDFALFRANLRASTAADQALLAAHLARAAREVGRDGIAVEVHGGFGRPPREVDGRSRSLYAALAAGGRSLGLDLAVGASGGASDGNLLAARGLPTLDGLGPRGGGLHTDEEFLVVPSLAERARLAARFLMGLGAGEIEVPPGPKPQREEPP
ncbi:MAG: hydrolase [Deferrisomatales bacterium]